jgi:hypothetical protein
MLYPANQSGCPSIPLQSLTPSNFPSLRCEPRPLGAVHHCNVARPMYVFNLCPVTHTLAKAVLIQSFQPDSSCYSPVPRSGKMSARSRVFSGVFIVPAHRDTPSSDAISSLLEIYIKSRCYGSAQDFTTTYSSYFTLYDTILRSYVPLSPFPSFFAYDSATGRLLTGSHLLSAAVFLCHAQYGSLLSIVMVLAMPPFLCANRYSDSTSRYPLASEIFAIIATRGVTTCLAPNKVRSHV